MTTHANAVSPPVTLITGATDGLGLALAQLYRQQHARLILVGRRPFSQTPLAQFSPNQYCQVDLARPDCAEVVTRWLAENDQAPIDLLIHNAGLGYYGGVAQQPPDNIETLVAVNLWAPIALTHRLLPHLRQPGAKIVFISSVVSALACPDYAVYGATKAALDGFARSLRVELKNTAAVQVIHPGAASTGMHAKAGFQGPRAAWERFPSAETVAAKIARAIAGGRAEVTIGPGNRLLRLGGRYAGPLVDWLMVRKRR